MFNSVLYPTFSKLKDEKKILIYFKSIYLVSLVTFPIMVIISFNADYIILNIFKINGMELFQLLEYYQLLVLFNLLH